MGSTPTYKATYSGRYSVTVTNGSICTETSRDVLVQVYGTNPNVLTWVGRNGRVWDAVGNWDCPCAIPTTGDTVYIPGGVIAPLSMPAISLTKLVIDNDSDISMTGNVSVTRELQLKKGRIYLNANSLTIAWTAAITQYSDTGYIITNGSGELIQDGLGSSGRSGNIMYPIGRSRTKYTPLEINNSSPYRSFRARVVDTVYSSGTFGAPITEHVVGDTWIVTESSSSLSLVSMTLYWRAQDELPLFSRSTSAISKYDISQWQPVQANGPASGSGWLSKAISLNKLGIFAIGDQLSVIPVELISFSGHLENGTVVLSWETTNETGCRGYYIERYDETVESWVLLTFVHANNNAKNTYRYYDQSIAVGEYQYRLKSQEYDGAIQQYPIITVSVIASGVITLDQNIPNPFSDATDVCIHMPAEAHVILRVYDAYGRVISNLADGSYVAGSHVFRFETKNVPRGIYYCQLIVGNIARSIPMLLVR